MNSYNNGLIFFLIIVVYWSRGMLVQFCLPYEMQYIFQAGGFAHTPVVSPPGQRQHVGDYYNLYHRHSQKTNGLQDLGSWIEGRWQLVCFNTSTENSEAEITTTVDLRGEEVLPHILYV